jgi:hypothetical protein
MYIDEIETYFKALTIYMFPAVLKLCMVEFCKTTTQQIIHLPAFGQDLTNEAFSIFIIFTLVFFFASKQKPKVAHMLK